VYLQQIRSRFNVVIEEHQDAASGFAGTAIPGRRCAALLLVDHPELEFRAFDIPGGKTFRPISVKHKNRFELGRRKRLTLKRAERSQERDSAENRNNNADGNVFGHSSLTL
jgi:hypothetical protein